MVIKFAVTVTVPHQSVTLCDVEWSLSVSGPGPRDQDIEPRRFDKTRYRRSTSGIIPVALITLLDKHGIWSGFGILTAETPDHMVEVNQRPGTDPLMRTGQTNRHGQLKVNPICWDTGRE